MHILYSILLVKSFVSSRVCQWRHTARAKLFFGIVLLIAVNIIWVASSEATSYLFNIEHYDKPFFTAYFKSTMFCIYLIGFLRSSWRKQCHATSAENGSIRNSCLPCGCPCASTTADPAYQSSGDSEPLLAQPDCDNSAENVPPQSEISNEPHHSSADMPLSARRVFYLACAFTLPWFCGSCSYQLALQFSTPALVNTVSSTSAIFTLLFAALCPVSVMDRFNLTKVLATLLCVSGVCLVSYEQWSGDSSPDHGGFFTGVTGGVFWALIGAACYAFYLVMLKKQVEGRENRLNILMFFGFVGVLVGVFLWPVLAVVNAVNIEKFQLPQNSSTWIILVANGAVGTVLAELLWLWGCFLTSSLLATVAMSLNNPLSMLADYLVGKVTYGWVFYIGTICVSISFLLIAMLNLKEQRTSVEEAEPVDPLLWLVHRFLNRRNRPPLTVQSSLPPALDHNSSQRPLTRHQSLQELGTFVSQSCHHLRSQSNPIEHQMPGADKPQQQHDTF